MLSAASAGPAQSSNTRFSSYPLYFATLPHTCIRQKSQTLSLQSLPHTCPENTRSGTSSTLLFFLESFAITRQNFTRLTPSFLIAAFHSSSLFVTLKEISAAFANSSKKNMGVRPSPAEMSAYSHRAYVRGTIYRALFVPIESAESFNLNAISVNARSQLEW